MDQKLVRLTAAVDQLDAGIDAWLGKLGSSKVSNIGVELLAQSADRLRRLDDDMLQRIAQCAGCFLVRTAVDLYRRENPGASDA